MLSFNLPLLFLLSLEWSAGAEKDFRAGLEPGHVKPEYDSVEEVRGHDNETKTEKPAEDEHLTREAILDVAYYLRRFKFSGHDPRYLAEGEVPKQNLFVEFPSPPLRNIHWEVRKNCEPSFVECVKYLQEQVSQTVLPRHLDSLTITKQNGWSFITDRDLIKAADEECLKLLREDEETFNAFSGPLERFQWLTSASYYMCLYTMRETPYLRNFTEECDNYGSCIQWEFGLNNKDVRGDNGQPFACAAYSFCPDPCCPLKYIPELSACSRRSPCFGDFSSNSTCSLFRKNNFCLESLILNRWNVSCHCDAPGFRWESKSGMCVDVDECTEPEPPCAFPSETCVNLPGTYSCVCSMLGYRKDQGREGGSCELDLDLLRVFDPHRPPPCNETRSLSHRLSTKFQSLLHKLKFLVVTWIKRLKEERNLTRIF